MPERRVARFDSGDRWDQPGLVWGPLAESPPGSGPLPDRPFTLNEHTNMEYWEVTKDRAQKTLPVWQTYVSALKIGTRGSADLEGLIDGFEPLVQERTGAQDDLDAAFRAVQTSLLIMQTLGVKVPQIIEAQLDENAGIMQDVDDLFGTQPRTESTILKRARDLYPVWVRANAAMAALVPTQPPIVRSIQGVAYTAVMLKAQLDGYTDLVTAMDNKESALNGKREALRGHDRVCDQLNKRWYKAVKANAEAGSALLTALEGIPTEPSTPPPETMEIDHVVQGGEQGRQALVSYVAGGGDHATTKQVQWSLPGEAEPWTHTAALDASGNALGPFPVGTVLTIRTLVSNSAGTRTTAPRTMTIGVPV